MVPFYGKQAMVVVPLHPHQRTQHDAAATPVQARHWRQQLC
jgi:hypothetical protein